MKKILILLIFASLRVAAQDTGIRFAKAQSWQQIQDSAKTEHKYIFVDCYTTWCRPCKMMEQQTYPVKEVGDAYNHDFICVKLQMDKTAKDNDTVKAWYATAEGLQSSYHINAFPSFLFFDENGKAVHKAIGYQEAAAFIGLSAAAKDPAQQYYTLLDLYKSGQLDEPGIAQLADIAGMLGDEQIGKDAAKEHMDYLNKLSDSVLAQPANQSFIRRHSDLVTSSDRAFKLCYEQPALIDQQNGKGTAFNFACFIITKEMVDPQLLGADQRKEEPAWAAIEKSIARRYGEKYVSGNDYLLDDKINWYKYKKNGSVYAHYLTIKTERTFKETAVVNGALPQQSSYYNESAFDIFRYDDQKADLEKALHWMEAVNSLQSVPDANLLDTQAGLLYKLGRKESALLLEKRALKLAVNNTDIQDNYMKMKTGRATWPAASSF
jgi:thioredoxin-related protein